MSTGSVVFWLADITDFSCHIFLQYATGHECYMDNRCGM